MGGRARCRSGLAGGPRPCLKKRRLRGSRCARSRCRSGLPGGPQPSRTRRPERPGHVGSLGSKPAADGGLRRRRHGSPRALSRRDPRSVSWSNHGGAPRSATGHGDSREVRKVCPSCAGRTTPRHASQRGGASPEGRPPARRASGPAQEATRPSHAKPRIPSRRFGPDAWVTVQTGRLGDSSDRTLG